MDLYDLLTSKADVDKALKSKEGRHFDRFVKDYNFIQMLLRFTIENQESLPEDEQSEVVERIRHELRMGKPPSVSDQFLLMRSLGNVDRDILKTCYPLRYDFVNRFRWGDPAYDTDLKPKME